jgi:hypothetical protein
VTARQVPDDAIEERLVLVSPHEGQRIDNDGATRPDGYGAHEEGGSRNVFIYGGSDVFSDI